MFQPMMPQFHRRGPIGTVADALAGAATRVLMGIGMPKRDTSNDWLVHSMPLFVEVLRMLKPPVPVDLDGPKVQQVKRELAAEEAHVNALCAEKRARLIAEFGPKLDAARAADEAAAATAFPNAPFTSDVQ